MWEIIIGITAIILVVISLSLSVNSILDDIFSDIEEI